MATEKQKLKVLSCALNSSMQLQPRSLSSPSLPSLSPSPLFSLAFLPSLLPPAFLLQAPKAKKKVKASLGVGKAAKKVVDYQDYENDLGGEFDDFM